MSAQTVRERASVRVVRVSLTARTASSKPVRDLTLDQLTLRVDGRPVAIDSLFPPSEIGGGMKTATATPETVKTAPASPAPPEPLHVAILLDERGTSSLDRRDVYRQLVRFLGGPAGEEREVMVARSIGQTVQVVCPWTRETKDAEAALRDLAAHAASPRIISPHEITELDRVNVQGLPTQVLFERERLFQAVLVALAAFPPTPARRLLVVVSGGTALLSPPDFAAALKGAASIDDTERRAGRDRLDTIAGEIEQARTAFELWTNAARRDWYGQLADVMAKAQEEDVALVPIDAEALDRGTNPGVEKKWAVRPMPGVRGDGGLSARLPVGQTMATLALQTGGEAILAPLRVDARLRDVQQSDPYILTFRDPFPEDHRRHRVEITTARKAVTLGYRRGYRTPTEEEEALDGVMARLAGPAPSVNPMSATVQIGLSTPPAGEPVLHLTARYQPPRERGLESQSERDVEVIVAAQDESGNRSDPAKWEGSARRVGSTIDFLVDFDLKIPARAYTWSVAVRDKPTGLVSFVTTQSRS